MNRPTELQQINTALRQLAQLPPVGPGHPNIALVSQLQARRMEIIGGPDWRANLAAWIGAAEELRPAH